MRKIGSVANRVVLHRHQLARGGFDHTQSRGSKRGIYAYYAHDSCQKPEISSQKSAVRSQTPNISCLPTSDL